MIYEVTQPDTVAELFDNWPEAVIWSALQGIMGRLYTDCLENPTAVMAILGDFCYFAGTPNRELVRYKPDWTSQDFIIMVPQNETWAQMIEECYGDKATRVTRYAIRKEPGIFDAEHLRRVVAGLPEGYELKQIDEEWFRRCRDMTWCQDFVRHYPNYEMYRKYGLGMIIVKDGELVSGASSYCGFRDGIEIEIITREDFRRRGLAYICGAGLILECMARGWYPSWDAQNKWSAALAQKLGYHYDRDYECYEIRGYGGESESDT